MSLIALLHRTIIEIKGEDVIAFLQGLTTNDITRLVPGGCLYTVFLNPQGKFTHDAFAVMPATDQVWLDVEAEHVEALLKKLTMYKLRSKVVLSHLPEMHIYADLDAKADGLPAEAMLVTDPRNASMGQRVYTNVALQAHTNITIYDERRIPLSIPDGTRDVPYERGFIMEYGFDRLNAIDFQKGCYVGQELTARMHYRKLGKRQLICVKFETNAPESGTDITQDGVSVGVLRSTCGQLALAHIKTEALEINNVFIADGQTMTVCAKK